MLSVFLSIIPPSFSRYWHWRRVVRCMWVKYYGQGNVGDVKGMATSSYNSLDHTSFFKHGSSSRCMNHGERNFLHFLKSTTIYAFSARTTECQILYFQINLGNNGGVWGRGEGTEVWLCELGCKKFNLYFFDLRIINCKEYN